MCWHAVSQSSFDLILPVEIDGQDVSHMLVPQVTALMLSKIHLERRLTVVSSTSVLPDAQEAKIEYGYTM